MPVYKQRTIKLTPTRHGDETWSCAYRIIDLSSTGWKFHKGHCYGSFGSRAEAAIAAEKETKRIIDAFELVTDRPWSSHSMTLRNCEDRIRDAKITHLSARIFI